MTQTFSVAVYDGHGTKLVLLPSDPTISSPPNPSLVISVYGRERGEAGRSGKRDDMLRLTKRAASIICM